MNCILYTTSGGKWKEIGELYEVGRNYHTMGQIQEEATETMLQKGTTGYSKNITTKPTMVLGLVTKAS